MESITAYILAAFAGLVGLAVGVIAVMMKLRTQSAEAEAKVQAATEKLSIAEIKSAEADANIAARHKELQVESREQVQAEVQRLRETIEKESQERRVEIKETEKRLRERETHLERRLRQVEGRDKALNQREGEITSRIEAADQLVVQQRDELERVAQLPLAEAREILLTRVEDEARVEMDRVVKRVADEAMEKAEEKARRIVTMAIQRCAVDQTAESAVSVVPLPSDELKGRIIGREGRNIRTFEQMSGCDLIIDDTPEAVVISSFEPVRREIARMALSTLSQRRAHSSGAHRRSAQ